MGMPYRVEIAWRWDDARDEEEVHDGHQHV
jgi:hypothetical protein